MWNDNFQVMGRDNSAPPQKKGGGRNDQRHKMKINVTEIKETKGIAKVSILLNVLETKLNKNFAWHLRQI